VTHRAKPPESREPELITKAQQGDRAAFGELVRHHRRGVINIVYRMSGDIHFAEDMAQEAFLRAWQKLASYQPRAPFRNWVYRIATNAALDVLRKEKDFINIDDVHLAGPRASPEDKFVRDELGDRIKLAIFSLPAASRAVLILREYEALSYREIAETLDIPMGTVMSRLHFARNKLRQLLAPDVEER
jgi:RNA polymerase sigma-70 factor (ECF subfamily)